jgi:thioredoxin 1
VVPLRGELRVWTTKERKDETDETENNHLGRGDEAAAGMVLMFFQAGWCVPCQQMMPVMRGIEKEGLVRVRTVDVDKDLALAEKYGVTSLPTLVLLRDGKEVHRKTGVVTADEVRELLRTATNGVFTFHVDFTR